MHNTPEVELEHVAKFIGQATQAPDDNTNPFIQAEAVTAKSHFKVLDAQAVQVDKAFKKNPGKHVYANAPVEEHEALPAGVHATQELTVTLTANTKDVTETA